jgi:purine-binding chemotaxis protein CheW
MDFLEIRRKAKERAAARAREAKGDEKAAAPDKPKEAAGRPRRRPRSTEEPVGPGEGGFSIVARGPASQGGHAEVPEQATEEAGLARRRAEAKPEHADDAPLDRVSPPLDPLEEFFYHQAESGPAPMDLGFYAAPQLEAPKESERRQEYLSFRLGSEEYALDISCVREILKAPAITEVPRAPDHVLGVILVRGEVIPVYDPRRRLGLPPASPGTGARLVVCDAGEGPAGLLVDAVSQVVRLPPSAIEARPQGIGGIDSEYLAGIGRERDRLFILLDAAALLRRPAADHPGLEGEGA